MKIVIYQNREVEFEDSKIGNDSENKVETLEFEFPEQYKDFTKYIEFLIKGQKHVDLIENNKYIIPRKIVQQGKIKTQIVLKKTVENDELIFKSNIFVLNVSASINAVQQVIDNTDPLIIQRIVTNLERVDENVNQLELDVKSLKNENETNKEKISNLKNDIEKSKQDILELQTMKVDKIAGKELSTNDFTNEYKQKLDELENYDDTLVKQEIEKIKATDIKQDSEINTNKTNIEQLQKDNTTNKQDISNIKKEQTTQNTDIEDLKKSNEEKAKEIDRLQEELDQTKEDFENYAIHEKTTGEYIYLTDSSETDCRVDVKGNSKQATSKQGKNKINLRDENYKVSDVNVTKKGSTLTLNGIMNAHGNILNTVGDVNNYIYLGKFKIGTYRFSKFIISGKYSKNESIGAGTFACYIRNKDKTSLGEIGGSANSGEGVNITLEEDTDLYIQIFCNAGAIFDNYVLGFQLEEGSVTTDFEQFVPDKPSLEYPSKIETVQGSVKVTACNKNLFLNAAKSITRGGIDFIVNEDGSVTANGTSTGSYFDLIDMLLKPGTYTFSGGPVNGSSTSQRLTVYKVVNRETYMLERLFGKNTYTTTFNEETLIRMTYVIQTGTTVKNEVVKPQIELGTIATEYVEHKEENVVLPVQKEMLEGDCFDKINNKELHNYEKKNMSELNWIISSNELQTNTFSFVAMFSSEGLSNTAINCISNCFKSETASYLFNNDVEGIGQSKSQIICRISKEKVTGIEEFKAMLKEKNAIVYIKKKSELNLTQEQIQALEKLDKLKTYKNITNITTDSIAILDADYKKDLETLINQVSQALVEGS